MALASAQANTFPAFGGKGATLLSCLGFPGSKEQKSTYKRGMPLKGELVNEQVSGGSRFKVENAELIRSPAAGGFQSFSFCISLPAVHFAFSG